MDEMSVTTRRWLIRGGIVLGIVLLVYLLVIIFGMA